MFEEEGKIIRFIPGEEVGGLIERFHSVIHTKREALSFISGKVSADPLVWRVEVTFRRDCAMYVEHFDSEGNVRRQPLFATFDVIPVVDDWWPWVRSLWLRFRLWMKG